MDAIDESALQSLGARLDELDLSEAEALVLDTLIESYRTAGNEVEGFAGPATGLGYGPRLHDAFGFGVDRFTAPGDVAGMKYEGIEGNITSSGHRGDFKA